jgi:hypothetical protein
MPDAPVRYRSAEEDSARWLEFPFRPSDIVISVPEPAWPQLVEAATFRRMRERAGQLAPDPAGVMKDRDRFFREERPGAGRELLDDRELARYHTRTAALAPPDLLAWLHRDASATTPQDRVEGS